MLFTYLKITTYVLDSIRNRFLVLIFRIFGIFKPKYIILKNWIKLLLRDNMTNDLSIITEVWKFEPYTNQIFFNLRKDDIIFDIWWHMGNFALYASLKSPQWEVHVFEPVWENFLLLEENIAINNASNIIVNNCAVWDKNGNINFLVSNNDKASHSKFSEVAHGIISEVSVIQTSLQSYMARNDISNINFLKLDCEWAEYEIIYNMSDEYLDKIEKISMEIHDNIPWYDRDQMMKFLERKWFYVDIKEVYVWVYNIFALNKNFWCPIKSL